MRLSLLFGIAVAFAMPLTGMASELRVLSGGAVEPGLKAAVADFERASGHSIKVTFNTAPQLRKRLLDCKPDTACEKWDVIVAPPAVLDELAKAGAAGAERHDVGRVGLGVAVRANAPAPDLADVSTFQNALLKADAIVFNRASTGLYFEAWLKKADLYDKLEARTVRFDDGAAVMERVLKGSGNDVAVGAITEILLYRDKGLRFVGPLPAAIQNYTAYAAAATRASDPAATALVQFLGGNGRQFFRAAGIE